MSNPAGGPANLPPLECRVASLEKRLDAIQTHVEAMSSLIDDTLMEMRGVAEMAKLALDPVKRKPRK